MNSRIFVTRDNGDDYFYLEQLKPKTQVAGFLCPIGEYNDYLNSDAFRSQSDHIALTWLLREHTSGEIAAYMSLIADAIKLSVSEKELHNLNYPFKTIPAMKIAKLAVAQSFQTKFKGIGSFMVRAANRIARACNDNYFAARFLTVDACYPA
jgi:hypothetical protein